VLLLLPNISRGVIGRHIVIVIDLVWPALTLDGAALGAVAPPRAAAVLRAITTTPKAGVLDADEFALLAALVGAVRLLAYRRALLIRRTIGPRGRTIATSLALTAKVGMARNVPIGPEAWWGFLAVERHC
jgi:hypothetical protein